MSPGQHDPGHVTRLLKEAQAGSIEALDRLMPLVYDELKGLASSRLRSERLGHTLNATALVHEAYFKLAQQERVDWQSRAHFFAVASEAMRRILINYAEARRAQKRGGGARHVSIDEAREKPEDEAWLTDEEAAGLLELHGALSRLAGFDQRGANVVQYRFFGGLSYEEIGEVLGISAITARRAWTVAKIWLRRELGDEAASRAGTLLSSGA